ncbi:hypothetical protein Tco_1293333 [Tanacetum coccineum]
MKIARCDEHSAARQEALPPDRGLDWIAARKDHDVSSFVSRTKCSNIGNYNGNINGFKRVDNKSKSSQSSQSSSSLSFNNDKMMNLMALINDIPSGNIQANMAGANQHMTVTTKNMFGIIDISDLNLIVGHSNGTLAKIKYDGNLQLSTNVVFGLGHPTDQVIDVLHNELQMSYGSHVSPCDICHKAKQKREPFLFCDHKSSTVGDLIHLDL